MEKFRQKAVTPEPIIITKDDIEVGCAWSHSKTPAPSRRSAGTANIIVANGAI